MRAQFPLVPVVVVSGSEEFSVISRAISLGALGFIPKSAPVRRYAGAISAGAKGDVWLPENVDLDAQGNAEMDDLAASVVHPDPAADTGFDDAA